MSGGERLLDRAREALLASIDLEGLVRRLGRLSEDGPDRAPVPLERDTILARLALADVLDEEILGAGPRDDAFPLRLFFGNLAARLEEEATFVLSCALNLFFRLEMDEETRLRLGIEVSRLYYPFVQATVEDDTLRATTSQLLAQLMSTTMERLDFEALDQVARFDSSLHERAAGADPHNASIRRLLTFAARLRSSGTLRWRAQVLT